MNIGIIPHPFGIFIKTIFDGHYVSIKLWTISCSNPKYPTNVKGHLLHQDEQTWLQFPFLYQLGLSHCVQLTYPLSIHLLQHAHKIVMTLHPLPKRLIFKGSKSSCIFLQFCLHFKHQETFRWCVDIVLPTDGGLHSKKTILLILPKQTFFISRNFCCFTTSNNPDIKTKLQDWNPRNQFLL